MHDAVSYLTTEDDLAACLATRARRSSHRVALVVAPDCTAETFVPGADVGDEDAPDGRGVRYLASSHPARDPGTTCVRRRLRRALRQPDAARRTSSPPGRRGVVNPEALTA